MKFSNTRSSVRLTSNSNLFCQFRPNVKRMLMSRRKISSPGKSNPITKVSSRKRVKKLQKIDKHSLYEVVNNPHPYSIVQRKYPSNKSYGCYDLTFKLLISGEYFYHQLQIIRKKSTKGFLILQTTGKINLRKSYLSRYFSTLKEAHDIFESEIQFLLNFGYTQTKYSFQNMLRFKDQKSPTIKAYLISQIN